MSDRKSELYEKLSSGELLSDEPTFFRCTRCCGTCSAYESRYDLMTNDRGESYGECRANPPTLEQADFDADEDHAHVNWPMVSAWHWCRQWAAATPEELSHRHEGWVRNVLYQAWEEGMEPLDELPGVVRMLEQTLIDLEPPDELPDERSNGRP